MFDEPKSSPVASVIRPPDLRSFAFIIRRKTWTLTGPEDFLQRTEPFDHSLNPCLHCSTDSIISKIPSDRGPNNTQKKIQEGRAFARCFLKQRLELSNRFFMFSCAFPHVQIPKKKSFGVCLPKPWEMIEKKRATAFSGFAMSEVTDDAGSHIADSC